MKLEMFQRVTSGKFIPAIDGLRFLAIMPVVLMHTATSFKKNTALYNQTDLKEVSIFNDVINTGALGVYLFFVISGFILSLPFIKQNLYKEAKVSLRKYFQKRLTRLEPPYLITLSILFLGHVIIQTSSWFDLLKHYLANFFYIHNFLYQTWSPINPVAWSLEIEIQFYILVPLLALIFLIELTILRRSLIIFIVILFSIINHLYRFPFGVLPSFLQYFLAGFLLADLYLSPIKVKIHSTVIDLLGVLAIISIFLIEYHKLRFLLPPTFCLIFWAAFKGGLLKHFFSNIWITTIGGMCYITYLIHFPLTFILSKLTAGIETGFGYEVDLLIQYTILIPITLAISAVAFVLLERPFMHSDWPIKLYQRLKRHY